MSRIFLFLATNIAILAVLSITMNLLGFNGLMDAQGIDLDMNALLVFSALLGFGGSLFSLMISKWTAKRFSGARVIEQPANQTEQWLYQTVERQSKQAGIKMPEVAIFDTENVNAFATGRSRNNALVAVSSGLLNSMTRDEAEAVIGHEISHVANGDMITMTLMQGVLNTFVIFFSRVIAHLVNSVLSGNREGGSQSNSYGMTYFAVSMVAQVLLGFLANMIVMWFSRYREFHADKGGANLAGRDKMIAALRRLQSVNQPHDLPGELAAFGISGGLKAGISKLMMTHPPLEDRIAALESHKY